MSLFQNPQGQNNILFGQSNQQTTQTSGTFGQQNQTANLFGANNTNNNKPTNSIFGANNNTGTNFSFGPTGNNMFNNNNQSTNTGSFLNVNNTSNQNPTNNIFNQNNQQNTNNNLMQQQKPNNNILGNLSGINSNNQNQNNNIFQQNNLLNNPNQARNQLLNLNDPKTAHDLQEFGQVLQNISNCCDPSQVENMFKDYLYMPISKGTSPKDANVYRPYTVVDGQQKIINDYNIWEEGNKNNVDPNKFFPIQISSVDALLQRYKNIEKGILQSISRTVETQKSFENLNKKIMMK